MNIVIERSLPQPGDKKRYGTLKANGFSCKTIEWPEDGAEHKCLPSGTYSLILGMHYGSNHLTPPYECYHIFNDEIPLLRQFEIHIGNTLHDSKGCVLVGTEYGTMNGEAAVLHSRTAYEEFMLTMNKVKTGTLVILYPSTGPNLDT